MKAIVHRQAVVNRLINNTKPWIIGTAVGGLTPPLVTTYNVINTSSTIPGAGQLLIPPSGLTIRMSEWDSNAVNHYAVIAALKAGDIINIGSASCTLSGAPVWNTDYFSIFVVALPVVADGEYPVSVTILPVEESPVNTVLPVISGTPSVGSVLSSTTGTWTGEPTPTYTYQWERGGVNIGSATNSTYTLVTADAGTNITCAVTATNSAGNATATSNTLAISGGAGLILDPSIALVGTSLTQYSSQYANLSSVTLTRDTNGLVSVPKSGHGLCHNAPIYVFNTPDLSFEYKTTINYIDANNFTYQTNVTGSPTTTVGGGYTVQNSFRLYGIFGWLSGLNEARIELAGNFGQGADTAAQMSAPVNLAANSAADIVIIEPAKNSINTSVTATSIMTSVIPYIDTLKAAGKKVIIISDTPVNATYATTFKNTQSLALNDLMIAEYGSDPEVRYAEVYTALVDPEFAATTGQAYSWVTSDGIHWGSRSAEYIAGVVNEKLLEFATFTSILPTAANDVTVRNGWKVCYDVTNWDGASSPSTGQGCSGVKSANTIPFCASASSTSVGSIESPTDGIAAYWQQQIYTTGANNSDLTIYIPAVSPPSLATLGLVNTDTTFMAVELEITGSSTANAGNCFIAEYSNNGYIYAKSECTSSDTGPTKSESFRTVFMTGELPLNSNVTTLAISPAFRLATITGNALTVRIRRCCIFKRA